ncbi:MAG: S-layer homology domain-containing protein [Oscillospiraceae bacterium]|jgi:hypothetical protein|nr:S-layer homology domain-containing protein [Oscillospiraceae bacterium]
MNNLKRVLSLALSTVMLVGMMAVGAGAADFTDAEKIQHSEAVNVLVALKVINGQDDGSFNPEGDVTRAQMAKMIAVTMNGGSEANTGTKTTPSFTDIKGHWAESYIEYCYDLGIISGRGDGTFDPEGKVTGLEATKMVLTAMGFDAAAYKLTGASWSVRTDEVARTMTGQGWTNSSGTFISEPNMYDGLLGTVMALNASRDTAAQLIWNGLQNRTRTVQPTTTGDGGVEWTYITNSTTLLNQRFGANVTTNTFKGNYYTGHTSTKGEIQVGTAKFPSDFDISNIGEEVKVIWKDGERGTKGQLDAKDVIFGVFNTGASRVVNATLADVKDQESNKAQINIDGTKYDTANSVDVVVNYTSAARTAGVLAANGTKSEDATNGSSSGNSDLTKALKFSTGDTLKAIIDPDDNEIKTIYVTTSKLAAVTAVNSSKVTMNNNVGAIKIEDNDVADGLKKGDVVAVTTLYKAKAKATDDDAFTIVKKAEVIEGEVDGWKESKTVTVDGTAQKIYNEAASFMLTGTAIPDEDNTITTFKDTGNTYIGEDVKLYMLNGYVGAAVQTSESASNYSLVTEVKDNVSGTGGVFTGLELQVMAGDSTKTIIKVDKNSPSGAVTNSYNVGDIVTYTMTDDNTAKVTKESAVTTNAKGAYDDEVKTFDSVLTTTDCVLFVQTKKTGSNGTVAEGMDSAGVTTLFSGAEYKVYKIRDLKTFGSSNVENGKNAVTNKDGKVVAAFVNMQNTPNGATDNTVYGIITAENGRIKDYYSYTVQSNGKEFTVNIDATSKTHAKGDLVWFEKTNDNSYDANDVHKMSAEVNKATVWTKEAEATSLTYFTSTIAQDGGYKGIGQTTLALEKDAPVIYVDTKNDKSEAEGSIGAFDSVTGYANALILADKALPNNTAKIKAVFIETSNEENIATVTQSLTANDIKDLDDGVYTPASVSGGAFQTSVTDPAKLRVFKFTGDNSETSYKIVIKNSTGTQVYEETGTVTPASAGTDDAHYFYLAVGDLSKLSGTKADTWSTNNPTEAPAGTYTYEIFAGAGTTAIEGGTGSFTY